jgi:hypothetical protein
MPWTKADCQSFPKAPCLHRGIGTSEVVLGFSLTRRCGGALIAAHRKLPVEVDSPSQGSGTAFQGRPDDRKPSSERVDFLLSRSIPMLAHTSRLFLLTFAVTMFGGSVTAQASFIDYRNLGTFTTSTLDVGGVTVTGGPGQIRVQQFWGVSIVGGAYSEYVDHAGGEVLRFSFNDGPAVNIVLDMGAVFGYGTANAALEAFSADGTSLGNQTVNLFLMSVHVSDLFGGQEIQSFRLTPLNSNQEAHGTGFAPWRVGFAEPASPVPAPPGIALALCGLMSVAITRAVRRRAGQPSG